MKNFLQFLNEAKNWAPAPFLYKDFEKYLSEFKYETETIATLFKLEQELQKIGDKYWWNREKRNWDKPHFAIDAKVHIFPELDKVKELIEDPDLDEDQMFNIFYAWLDEIREMFSEDITESYDWIDAVNWGGRSGGWLLISPELTYDNIIDEVFEVIDYYQEQRGQFKYDEPLEYSAMQKQIDSEEWNSLYELGLIDIPDEMSEIMGQLNILNKNMNHYIDKLKQMDIDMIAIEARISNFSKTGEANFYTYLEQDYIY